MGCSGWDEVRTHKCYPNKEKRQRQRHRLKNHQTRCQFWLIHEYYYRTRFLPIMGDPTKSLLVSRPKRCIFDPQKASELPLSHQTTQIQKTSQHHFCRSQAACTTSLIRSHRTSDSLRQHNACCSSRFAIWWLWDDYCPPFAFEQQRFRRNSANSHIHWDSKHDKTSNRPKSRPSNNDKEEIRWATADSQPKSQ